MICPKCKVSELKEIILFSSIKTECVFCDNTNTNIKLVDCNGDHSTRPEKCYVTMECDGYDWYIL